MIRAAVVEDDIESREKVNELLKRYEEEENITIHTTFYTDGIHIVDEFQGQYDIVFCDIQMKIMNGLETARIIRKKNKNVIIIFITNLAEYAIQGYEVAALGYLLKPIKYTIFSMYMDRAVKIISERKDEYILFEGKNGIKRYCLSEITYIDYIKHYSYIHLKNNISGEANREYISMKEMEERLEGKSFSRCNSGCIVNLAYVQSIEANMVVVNGESITISRARKKQFMNDMTEYLGRKINE